MNAQTNFRAGILGAWWWVVVVGGGYKNSRWGNSAHSDCETFITRFRQSELIFLLYSPWGKVGADILTAPGEKSELIFLQPLGKSQSLYTVLTAPR